MTDYLTVNRANWDERAPAHAASPDYGVERFAADPGHLSDVVRFDRPRLGDIAGLRAVHLQCHIGTDTVSLARLGARMTGLDFSGASLTEARRIAALAGAEIPFVQSDVYHARDALDGDFDLVYTGIGALGWLPDIRRWASTVASLLAPGGRLFIREGHPVLWACDYDRTDDVIALAEPYFEQISPQVYDEPGTYVATDHQFQHTVTHEWNHGLGEIVTAVLDAGLVLTGLEEHQSVPWNALPRRMRALENGEYQLADRPERLPHTYTLQARKPA
ncbi:class I SAM-dependent methyltransferase [Actinoplanes sp. NPDC051851]|uniref:class I SAM-dependent methyltransferase n=1 Tax=Actinoplanes sp. NPDC051851 TaxID=3154753 RepID=UPI0034431112